MTERLTVHFERDHQHLVGMLDDIGFLCRKGSYVPAAKVFGELRRLLDRHLSDEDAVLEMLAREGMCPAALKKRIGAAHVQLKELLERTGQAVSRNDDGALGGAIAELSRAVTEHEQAEKKELLPVLRAAIRDPRRLEAVVHRLADR